MGYPEEALAPEEQLVLHRHPHWKMLFWPAVTFILITALAGFGLGVAARNTNGNVATGLLIGIGVLWLVIVLWRSVISLIRWKSTHFIITDRRVLIRQGVLTHTGIDIPMNRISNVQFRHRLFDRLLGTGTLIIGSASEDPLEYDDIPHVQQVHALLYHQVFDVVQNDPRNHGSPPAYP